MSNIRIENVTFSGGFTFDVPPPPPPPPVANFTSNIVTGTAPLNVSFTDTSTGNPTSWLWNFGVSGATSTQQNPSYTYANAGNYTVTLTATNSSGSNTIIKTNYITANSSNSYPGTYVATLDSSPIALEKILTSSDTTSWTFRNAVTSQEWDSITYGQGKFVAIGSQRTLTPTQTARSMVSTDGINWTGSTSGLANVTYNGIVYDANVDAFFALGFSNALRRSTDGLNWSNVSLSNTTTRTYFFAAGGTNQSGQYIIMAGSSAGFAHSNNGGVNWTVVSSTTRVWRGAAYGDGVFILVGDNGWVGRSTSGTAFASQTQPRSTTPWLSVAYGNINGTGRFIIVSNNTTFGRKVLVSDDTGLSWYDVELPTTANTPQAFWFITYKGGLFMITSRASAADVTQNIAISPDGLNWTLCTTPAFCSITAVAAAG